MSSHEGARAPAMMPGVRIPRSDPAAVVAVATALGLLVLALFGDRLAPHESIYFVVEHRSDPRPYEPGTVFGLGSDVLGRDLLSLVLVGARATLTIVLLAGVARVVSGIVIATVGSLWRPARLMTDWLADLVYAIPATLVALIIVRIFVRTETSFTVFVAALLVMGWAGPYRLVRAELDRVAHAPFTQGAIAMGASPWRVFWRHQLPHLAPVIALNLSQQVVASLVLVAELGVLGVAVGVTRTVNIEESLSRVITGQVNVAQVSDPPEWGELLANARTIESLWTTRWLVFVPGVAFAITALALAFIGFVAAQRYARRDVTEDLRSPGMLAVAAAVAVLFVLSATLPERYVAAREWASVARSYLGTVTSADAFAAARLAPLGSTGYAVSRDTSTIAQSGPATVSVGALTLRERWPEPIRDTADPERNVRAYLTGSTGGGTVDAPLVFVGRGISADDYTPQPQVLFGQHDPDFAQVIRDYHYADDYAGVDVRGKTVLLVRFLGIRVRAASRGVTGIADGPSVTQGIANAIKRGAAAVIFVDPALTYYTDHASGFVVGLGDVRGGTNPYLLDAQRDPPAGTTGGTPVIVLSQTAGMSLVQPFGIDLTPYLRYDTLDDLRVVSVSRDLGAVAHLQIPLVREAASATSYVAEVSGASANASRVIIWAPRRPGDTHPTAEVLAALAQSLGARSAPFIFVDFDPVVDPYVNAKAIRALLGGRRIGLVIVLDRLDGSRLRFVTPHGDLIPAFDLYAREADARADLTTTTASISDLSNVAPFIDMKTILVRGNGGDGDLRPDATALLGYLAGRYALGSEEVPR